MALGYCMICEQLKAIRPGSQRWGSRQVDWYPVLHDGLDGKRCPGDEKAIR